jgi:hypothetical protein
MYEDEHIYLTTFMYNIGKKLAGFGVSQPADESRRLRSFDEEPRHGHHQKHHGKHGHNKYMSIRLARLRRYVCYLPLAFIGVLIFVHLGLMSSFHAALL